MIPYENPQTGTQADGRHAREQQQMQRPPRNTPIDWLSRFGLILAAFAISLILGEVGLRLIGLSFPVFDTYDEVRGVKLVPGKRGWYRKEGAAYLEINSLGYRDREHDLAKPPGTFRIAVLGDSFTEARQMPVEDTYWHHLGEALATCPALAGQKVEVLNFGIGGYGTAQELLTYDLDARRFEPDLVLLGFFAGNDVRENSKALSERTTNWLTARPFFRLTDDGLELSPPEPLPAWKRWIYDGVQHSRLLELVNEARRQWSVRTKRRDQERRLQQIEMGISAEVYQPADDPDLAEAWTLTERILAKLAGRVQADGARFMVVTIPSSVQTHPDVAYRDALTVKLGVDDLLLPERRLTAFGHEDGYPVFPLVAAMQAAAGDRHFHGFANTGYGQGHMNAAGHEAMAKLLAPKICSELGKGAASSTAKDVVAFGN